MHVEVHGPTIAAITVAIRDRQTIKQLKQEITRRTGIPVRNQLLRHRNIELVDEHSVRQSEITTGDSLILIATTAVGRDDIRWQ